MISWMYGIVLGKFHDIFSFFYLLLTTFKNYCWNVLTVISIETKELVFVLINVTRDYLLSSMLCFLRIKR